jgi:hypothetical protein
MREKERAYRKRGKRGSWGRVRRGEGKRNK